MTFTALFSSRNDHKFSSWLELIVQQFAEIKASGLPYQTAGARIALLQEALPRAMNDYSLAPEIPALLRCELLAAWLEDRAHPRAQEIETAIPLCEADVSFFTKDAYQYACIVHRLAIAYRERPLGSRRDNLERSIVYFQEALQVFTLASFPDEHAQTQYNLSLTYRLCVTGERRANFERAITCCHEALRVWTRETLPYEYAQIQQALANLHLQRIAGERRENLEQAIIYYYCAQEILTRENFPDEYAQIQNNRGIAYAQRIAGERRENLERTILCYQQALQIWNTQDRVLMRARCNANLGATYLQRIAGERRENLEQAIVYFEEALPSLTREKFPAEYAQIQNNRGIAYSHRVYGGRCANLEQAIACYKTILSIWTRETSPYQYAKVQSNLAHAYQELPHKEHREALEQAISCHDQALQILTRDAFPYEYAQIQHNLGEVYQKRIEGDPHENLNKALMAYDEALYVYTCDAFPTEHRQVQLLRGEIFIQRREWENAHSAYLSALYAEELLVMLSAGVVGQDSILKDGRNAATRHAFSLLQQGRIGEAAIEIERGRARGLAEATHFNTADPERISDEKRRYRYKEAWKTFRDAHATLYAPVLDEDIQRSTLLDRGTLYRTAKVAFTALIEEIRAVQDPGDFLDASLDTDTILKAAAQCGPGHAIVYLASTPWGGLTIAAFANHPRFAALFLPRLTDKFVDALIETHLDDDREYVTGGFACAQQGNVLALLQDWLGDTFRERAQALHAACVRLCHECTLDRAIVQIMALPELIPLLDQSVAELSNSALASLLNTLVLQQELARCLPELSEVALRPVVSWLLEEGVTSMTLIPCGPLMAFPLPALQLADGCTVSETLATSVAPSARTLFLKKRAHLERAGIYALGNPYPTRQELRWGEAEALTLVKVGEQVGLTGEARLQWEATREWLIEALHKGYIVEASCHGSFDAKNFLRSQLLLANGEALTLADLLSYQVDLHGLRLLILSACQTALLSLRGASDEVYSLAAGVLQAGAEAVLATLWAVDDRATFLLIARFAQEWFPHMQTEKPAKALARAQHWLCTVTNKELQAWEAIITSLGSKYAEEAPFQEKVPSFVRNEFTVSRQTTRFDVAFAQDLIQLRAETQDPEARPYEAPYYWAAFQITGW